MNIVKKKRGVIKVVVRMGRLELPHLAAPDPKSGVSTISPHPHIKNLRWYALEDSNL